MYNKIVTLLLFASFATAQGIFASPLQEEYASKTTLNSPTYSIAMYSHELAKLVSQKETITQKYAPNNIARKSFNDLKSTDTVTIEENDYSIEGLRDVTEEKADKKRKDFLDSLPHDYAVASNTFMGLVV